MYYYRNPYYPSAWDLAPYEIKPDEKTTSRGNPDLKPEIINNIGLSHIFKKKNMDITSTINYRKGNDLIFTEREYDEKLNLKLCRLIKEN